MQQYPNGQYPYQQPYNPYGANPYAAPNANRQNNPYPHPPAQPAQSPQPAQPAVQPPAPAKPNKGFKIFIIVLVLFLAIGVGALTTMLIMGNDKQTSSSSDSSQIGEEKDFDSLEDNALKPGVDSGNNDLQISIKKSAGNKLSTSEIAQKSENCVIGISTYSKTGILEGEASGIVIGTNSKNTKTYVLTCAHVVAENEGDDTNYVFRVMDSNSAEYTAAVIGYDKSCDVAVLSVEKTGFKVAEFADSSLIKSGETVVAVGNPGGSEFYGSVTQGIVSATDRMVQTSMSSMVCIQHDAAINPGSSGGALFNVYGQVIGMNYSKFADTDYEGMSFAVPSKTLVERANKIIKTSLKTSGAKIGIEYYVAASYFDDSYKQLVINSIDKKSDLYGKAEVGDFIIAANGEKIKDKYTLIKMIGSMSAGDEIKLTIAHKNSKGDYDTKDVTVKLIEK